MLKPLDVKGLALALACALTVPCLADSEPIPLIRLQHKGWTNIDGAPGRNNFIAQGADGALWISAIDGLYRFDGVKYTFFHLPETVSPTANYYYFLRVSSSGVLFAGSFRDGIITVDQGKVRAFGEKEGLPHAPIVFLAEGPDRRMRCVSAGKILRLDADHWDDEGAGTNLPAGVADTLLFDRAGTLWVATNNGKLYFRPPGDRSFHLADESWDPALGNTALLEGPDGSLWICLIDLNHRRSTIRQLDVRGHPVSFPIRLQYPYIIWNMLFDRSGALWVTGQGVRRITFSASGSGAGPEATGTQVLRDEVVTDGLSSPSTTFLCEDNEGDIWASTFRGVDRFRTPSLVAFTRPAPEAGARPDAALGNGGRVWIYTEGQPITGYIGDRQVALGPKAQRCSALFEDREGTLWFADSTSLRRFERGHLSEISVPREFTARRVNQIAQLPNGSMLFLINDYGLWKWNAGQWSGIPANLQPERQSQISAMLPEPNGKVWIGYASGRVATWNGDITSPILSVDQSRVGMVYAFLETSFGLVVSGNNGVAILRHGSFAPLRFVSSTEIVAVSGMIQSADGDLWLNSGHGIIRVAKREIDLALGRAELSPILAEVFSEPEIHGPPRLLADMPTVERDATGRLWFNTSDTIAYIDPSNIARNTISPILTISSISADGHQLATSMRVPAGSGTLRLQYFGSNLTAPEKVRYKYRLDGVDRDWQDVGNRTEAVYTHLRPGSYSFHVMATNGESAWSEPVESKFEVLPTFYQTSWFLALCGALVAFLVLAIYKMRIMSLAARLRDRAEERANERIRIARDLHDTLLQGFQGLMLSFHAAVQSVPVDSRARTLLETALLKADHLVIEGRDRVGRLRSESLEGVSLPDAIKALGEELKAHRVCQFEVRITAMRVDIRPQVKDELFCIAREAITNSFRHAEAASIGADLDFGKRALSMTCYDDGCGIDAATIEQAPRFHYGILGMRERARRLGASYACDSAPGCGTKLIVCVPAGRAYEQNGWFSVWFASFHPMDSAE